MRYQSVVPSNRAINFARQFLRSIFFITTVQQNLAYPLAKRFRSKIALNSTPMANGNAARLFRNNDSDRIRLLGNSKRSSMSQAQAAVQGFALAYWKNTGRGCDSAITDNHAAVVKSSLWVKNAQQELDRKIGVERYSSFLVNPDRGITLNCEQGAKLFVGKLSHSFREIVNRFALFAS